MNASAPSVPGGGSWFEIARSTTIASGKISIGSLDLSDVMAVQVALSDIQVTTDDSVVQLRLHVSGSEVATGYRWTFWRGGGGGEGVAGSDSDTEIHMTDDAASTFAVGNAATEALSAAYWVFHPGSGSLYKPVRGSVTHSRPDGNISIDIVGGVLENTGALTGVSVLASSDLTGGEVIVMGLA